jgi:tetratricopeptide (TPR) repeat protein
MRRSAGGWRAGLLALLVMTSTGRAAAPPVSAHWQDGELLRVQQIAARMDQAALRGDFPRALRLAREALKARRALQGERHWQTLDAGFAVQRWERLARLPPEKQGQVGAALQRLAEGQQQRRKGQYRQAEQAYRAALALSRQTLGEEHPETVIGYNNVAGRLNALGKAAEALSLYRKALGIRRQALGEGHPHTAESYNNVAYCLQRLGKAQEALPLFRKALEVNRQALGEGHPHTAHSYNNVAACLQALGKAQEALPLYRKALGIHRQALGEGHPHTAGSYNNVAYCLNALGKFSEALPLFRKALEVNCQALGEGHPHTAGSYNNVAFCLQALGKFSEALPLYRKALEIHRQALGEGHPHTAGSYNNVAFCLQALGKAQEALPLFRKALEIRLKVLGQGHPDTATSYNNVAGCLLDLGKGSEALPLFRKALEIDRQALGEGHPDTATSYNNVAGCLNALGKAAEALPLYRKALGIRRQALGEGHPLTAESYNNVGTCLNGLGKFSEALPLFRKALEVNRQALGEGHPDTAHSYNNVAYCLNGLGKAQEALPLFRKALEIRRQARGEGHPDTAHSYNNVASCLHDLGKAQEALPLFRKALEIRLKVLGQGHPDTATSYNNVAWCLNGLGKRAGAMRHLRLALLGLDVGRHSAAAAGFDRSLFAATQSQPRLLLACLLAADGKASEAWRHAEAHLARGLLEALSGGKQAEDVRSGELAQLDARIVPLLGMEKPTAEQQKQRDELVRHRRALLAAQARRVAGRLDELVWPFPRVQKHLRADDALLLWLDAAQEHFACLLRQEGEPRFVRLPGSGKDGRWTLDDWQLAGRVHAAVRQPRTGVAEARKLVGRLRQQRLAPVEKHLKALGKVPAVHRLVVVPVGVMADVPVELLAEGYTLSYAPSATLFVRGVSRRRELRLDSLVALGDPVFQRDRPNAAAPPEYGLLLREVRPGGNAARNGLRSGDVLMRYNRRALRRLADFQEAKGERVQASAWRNGEVFAVRLGGGPLGARLDERPLARALPAWREAEALLRGEGAALARLPGTRAEVEAIAALVGKGKATLLLGSAASEQRLDRLLGDGTLGKARAIHLATHGHIAPHNPEHSALALAADALPDPVEQQRRGRKVYDGWLRVRSILDGWELGADLVVLSACETGRGKDGGGEGLLGFAQAFLQKGARSVVLSRWKVDDRATTLLMVRFYQNLLGKRPGLKAPLGKAEALREAQAWLRGLSAEQAGKALASLPRGVGKRAVVLPRGAGPGSKPFDHPYYWAAFVLVGAPD